jgi:hypothetical protein
MKTKKILALTAATAIALATAPAWAIDLNVGGIGVSAGGTSGGGTGVSVGSGGTSTGVTVGGGSTLASVSGGSDGTGAGFTIGTTDGDLVATSQDGNTTNATVNLGSGLGDLGLGNLGLNDPVNSVLDGNGNPNPNSPAVQQIASAYGALGAGEQQLLKNRCRSVLSSPSGFDPSLVALCRVIQRLGRR